MIPARLGSQRLKKKNLEKINGTSLIRMAALKAIETDMFDKIFVNTESEDIAKEVEDLNKVEIYKRDPKHANNSATSEDFVFDFLQNIKTTHLIQLHSIAPLLTVEEIKDFVNFALSNKYDVLLSTVSEQIECIYRDRPINFSFQNKENSQELEAVKRVTWSITYWNAKSFLTSKDKIGFGTYNGSIGTFDISRNSGIIVKHIEDLERIRALSNVTNEHS